MKELNKRKDEGVVARNDVLDGRKTEVLEQVLLCRCRAKDSVERVRFHSHSSHLFVGVEGEKDK